MSTTVNPRDRSFTFNYEPGELRCGRGCVAHLDKMLVARDLESALVVTGTNVGANPDVMGPIEAGLGDRLAGVFDETTPEKYLSTGLTAADRVRGGGVDSIVAVGSGSSLDIAKVASALTSHDDPKAAATRALDTGTVPVAAERDPVPLVAVPTTLAGADLSILAGVGLTLDPGTMPDDEVEAGGVSDRRLMPTALLYDLSLFETTPRTVLCASAMNGFDKAVECLYSPYATPVTDATAMRALSLMQSGFETLPEVEKDERRLYDSVVGIILAQYGLSTPDAYRASLIHAFGHGFNDYGIHQGTAHGILAPHVLAYLFDETFGRRDLLAEAFGVGAEASDVDLTEGIVDAVAGVSDALRLPSRLREIDDLRRVDIPGIAEEIRDDDFLNHAPDGVEPDATDIEAVLEAAW